MTEMQMYWLTRWDGIKQLFVSPIVLIPIVAFIVSVAAAIVTRADRSEGDYKFPIWPKVKSDAL